METLNFDVNYPQQCVTSLGALSNIIRNSPQDYSKQIKSVFKLASTEEPLIILHLLKFAKNALKYAPQLADDAEQLLGTVLSCGYYENESCPLLADLALAVLYLQPFDADILLERSLPEGSEYVFPERKFSQLVDLFVAANVHRAAVVCLRTRIAQYCDLHYHYVQYFRRFVDGAREVTKQFVALAEALTAAQPAVFYFDKLASSLAIPVGSQFQLQDYMQVARKAPLEPQQKQSMQALLKQRDERKLADNQKYKEREFEVYYVIPYNNARATAGEVEKACKALIEGYLALYSAQPDNAVALLSLAQGISFQPSLDALLRIYESGGKARLLALRLLVQAARTDKYVHQAYAKIYDNISPASLNSSDNGVLFQLLRQVFRNASVDYGVKTAILLKLSSCLLYLRADSLLVAVLLVFSAILRDPRLLQLIQQHGAISATQACQARGYQALLDFLRENVQNVNIQELNIVKNSTFSSVHDYLHNLEAGETLKDDLDLDQYINVRLDSIIRQKEGEKIFSPDVERDIISIQKKMYLKPETAENYAQLVTGSYQDYIVRQAQQGSNSELLVKNAVKQSKLAIQKQIENQITQLFCWNSGDLETKISEKRIAQWGNSEVEVQEENWQGEQDEE